LSGSTNERLGGMLVFVLVFLGVFFVLVASIPAEFFFTPGRTYQNYVVPDNFDPMELGGIAFFTQHNITVGDTKYYTFTNSTLELRAIFYPALGIPRRIEFEHLYWYFGPIFLYDSMQIETEGNYYITREDAVSHWISNVSKSKFYPVWCNHARVTSWIYDPNSSRDDVGVAWDAGTVTVAIGFGFEYQTAAINGWSLIGALLSFQSPQIFGMTGLGATVMNLIISLPVWGCVGYLVIRILAVIVDMFKPFG
jgi:hypothetical protein